MLKFYRDYMKQRTRLTLLLVLLLLSIVCFLLVSKDSAKQGTTAVLKPTAPKTVPSSLPDSGAQKALPKRKPLTFSSKGKIRLKPGESAVLGYWEISPGMNGMAIVTPETTPEGHVKMTAKLLRLSDDAIDEAEVQDLFPDVFDFENYSAIGSERLRGLQKNLQSTKGVDMLSMPTVMTRPGQRASISIGNSNDSMLSLDLQADPVAEDGGYNLSLDLLKSE